jgi:acyl-CoA reductase-like NAD-dependent aldehyde dehydrogenase
MEARKDEFIRLLTREQGKPLPESGWEVDRAIHHMRHVATMDLPLKVLKEDATQRVIQQHAPLGVVAAITPWNVPVLLLIVKTAPALLTGNTMVIKPAPTTPLTMLKFGELCAEILPPGVVNIIVDNNDLGEVLTKHPDIAAVTFTGSTATGKKVMQSAAGSLKRLTLELGGNDAAIVLDDVDPKEVAPKIFASATIFAGQGCIAIKRVYVHDSQYDAMCDELGRLARDIVVDDGIKQGTQMGPLQNKAQFERVRGFLEEAKQNGKIVAGGEVLPRKGYFVQPTTSCAISATMQDWSTRSSSGPVLPVLRYADVDDAIARANDSPYGLGGSVWSADLDRAAKVAAKVNSGTIWINKHLDVQPDVPIGGSKQSGIGTEMGQEGLEEFTQRTIINMAL